MLRKLGDRLGIIEFSSAPPQPSVPAKIQTRTLTLTELVMNIQITEVRVLAELGAVDWSPEALAIGKQAAYLWCPAGIIESKLAQAMTRALGERATMRNWATVGKLQAMLRDA